MQVILIAPDGTFESKEVSSFTDIKALIGGHVEVVSRHKGNAMLVDEEGLLKSLPPNVAVPALVGPIVLAPKGWEDLPYNTQGE
jgi:hypothetical protein